MVKLELRYEFQKKVFDQYNRYIQELPNPLDWIEAKMTDVAKVEPYWNPVAKLRCFKGELITNFG